MNQEIINRLKAQGHILLNEPMSSHTSFKTGGPADLLIFPRNINTLGEIVKTANENGTPLTVIGGCTNLLVGDRGIRGIVAVIKKNEYTNGKIYIDEKDFVHAESSLSKNDFLDYTIKMGFEGMEFMAGIPGCIGGGIVMNAGCDRGAFIDILTGITYIDNQGRKKDIAVTNDMAKYRSLYIEDAAIIAGGVFKLKKTRDIERIRKTVNDILAERSEKHPLDFPSAGSVFKNPENFSSWKLVQDAGLKGKRIGGAMVSKLHTNFIINFDKASSLDIRNLIEFIQDTVYKKFNVTLETEIRMLGEF